MSEDLVLVFLLLGASATIAWQQAFAVQIVRFPFLYSLVWAAFVLPRLLDLLSSGHPLAVFFRASGTTWRMAIFAALSLPAGLLGYYCFRPVTRFGSIAWDITPKSERKLVVFSSCVLIVAWVAVILLAALVGGPINFFLNAKSYDLEWSGMPVYYVFVAKFIYIPLVIFLFLYVESRRPLYLAFLVLSVLYPALNLIFLFRRSEVLILGLIAAYCGAVWLRIRWKRIVVVLAVIVGLITVYAFPIVRGAIMAGTSVNREQLGTGIAERAQFAPNTEIAMAAFRFFRTDQSGNLQLGAAFYDAMVQQFVPAGLVGKEVKQSLMIVSESETDIPTVYDFKQHFYLAPMGFSQAYEQFAGLGFVVFFVLGALAGWLEKLRLGSFRGEVLYILMLPILVAGVSNDILLVAVRLVSFSPVLIMLPKIGPVGGKIDIGRSSTRTAALNQVGSVGR